MSQQGSNYLRQGDGAFVVTGKIVINGGQIVPSTETQAGAISNLATNLANDATGTQIATAVNAQATAINAILAAMRGTGHIATA